MILSLSRLQSGLYAIQKRTVDLDKEIHSLINEYQPDANQKKLQLIYENTIGPASIISDSYCVVQSIRNLLENAIKYTYKGYVSLKLYQDNPTRIKLDVQDTGIGIREEYRQRLFEPFSQEDASNTRQFEGIGLGLAITRKLLDAIRARITVASTKDVGSTFTISFRTGLMGKQTRGSITKASAD
jgi:signal transduction histidine kinase